MGWTNLAAEVALEFAGAPLDSLTAEVLHTRHLRRVVTTAEYNREYYLRVTRPTRHRRSGTKRAAKACRRCGVAIDPSRPAQTKYCLRHGRTLR